MQELTHSQFLDLLRQRGIEISARDGHLLISAPRGAVDSELHAELTRRKPEMLAALEGATASQSLYPLVPRERNSKVPQTHAQQGMWLIDYFAPGNAAYNIPQAFLIEGPVDAEVLQKAVDNLLARHEVLQTYFYEDKGELLQAVSSDAKALVGFTDISTVTESDREQKLQQLLQEQARQSFDLSHAPLVRFHLFRLTKQRHVIFSNIHHIIADRRSLTILQEELGVLYLAAARNEAATLPDLPIQYADYAVWISKHLDSTAMTDQIQYWKTKLAGAPPFLELPSSRPYPEQRTAEGATVPVVISASLQAALNLIGRQEGATMFMTLLTAFAVLLYKHSGKEDFCIGSPFTSRNQIETEPLIGLFVNMLALRCQMAGDPSFRESLRRVRATALEAYEHGDIPFQEVVRALRPDPRLRRSPLFQIMFGFDPDMRSGPGSFIPIDTNPGKARFDLTLQLGETPDGIAGTFEYSTDLFDAESVEQMATQFVALLGEVTQHPDRKISSIELFSSSETGPTVQ